MSCNASFQTSPWTRGSFKIANFKCPGFVAYDVYVAIDNSNPGFFTLAIQGPTFATISLDFTNGYFEEPTGLSNISISPDGSTLNFTYAPSNLNYELNYQFVFTSDGPTKATVSKSSGSMGTPLNNPNHPLNNPNHPLNNPNHPLNLNRHPNAPVESFKNMCRWDFWNWLWFLIIVLIVVYLIYYFAYKKKTINFEL